MIEFFVPIRNLPTVTHQQKQVSVKNGKPVFYEPDSLKEARALLSAHLGKYIPEEAYDGPLECVVKWCFHTEAKNRNDGDYRDTKPDTHNLNKLLFDVMSDLGYWIDDARVVREIIEKFWVKESPPGIYIRIKELPKNGFQTVL